MKEIIQNRIQLDLEPEIIGQIDLLIENGIYFSRIDFLQKSIIHQLNSHKKTIEKFKVKNDFVLGLVNYSRKDLEKVVAQNKKLNIKVIGGLTFDQDITPELANESIEKIRMAGVFKAPMEVKKILSNRHFTLLGKPKNLLLKESNDDSQDWNEL